jgi:hypothetical protein|tara:strand:+ start:4391 stop:5290 length:900 start_codon:yes stop_codon:yes gene_type:complete
MAEVESGSVEAGNPGEAQTPSGDTGENVTIVPGSPLSENSKNTGWIEGVADPATKQWAIAKGLQNGNFENVLGSYHNLEKMVGADKAGRTITLLGDDASPEDRATYFNKLGRPESAEKYSVALPEGSTDDTRLTMMRNKAFDLGISDAQFSGIAEADAAYIAATTQGISDKAVVSAADAEAQLRTTWGAAYDQKVAGIDVAAHKLGIGEDQLNGLREAMGPVDAMKFVDGLNSKIGDHQFDYGETVIPGHKTPDQAKTEMSELSMNKEFMDAWMDKQHPGHKAAVEKKSALARLTTGVV